MKKLFALLSTLNSLVTAVGGLNDLTTTDKTSIVKMLFADNELTLSGDSSESGKSEDKLGIQYTDEELLIAFNYKCVLDAFRVIESDEVIIGLNASLSATVLRPNSDEDFICLIMPVQIR